MHSFRDICNNNFLLPLQVYIYIFIRTNPEWTRCEGIRVRIAVKHYAKFYPFGQSNVTNMLDDDLGLDSPQFEPKIQLQIEASGTIGSGQYRGRSMRCSENQRSFRVDVLYERRKQSSGIGRFCCPNCRFFGGSLAFVSRFLVHNP